MASYLGSDSVGAILAGGKQRLGHIRMQAKSLVRLLMTTPEGNSDFQLPTILTDSAQIMARRIRSQVRYLRSGVQSWPTGEHEKSERDSGHAAPGLFGASAETMDRQ